MIEPEVVIKVDKVYKNFNLPHQRKNSVKSVFTGIFDRKSNREIETQHALKNISFEIKKGEFFGIVGRNGSGKSTLLKILAGIYQPTKGSVSVTGKLVPFIELGVGFNPELTGRENVYLNGALLGFEHQKVAEMYDDIVEFAELEKFMDQKLKNYSSGMQVRLAFSMAIRAEADILLIDEVLAVGDADFQRKCFEYFKSLKKNKKTVVFVSHDMDAVREYCDRVALIEKSNLVTVGVPSKVTPEYSKLFVTSNDTKPQKESDTSNRWGNKDIYITDISTAVDSKNITLSLDAKINKEINSLIYGIHITGSDGHEITAMNNRMIDLPDIVIRKNDKSVSLKWKILNIFSDGKYNVTFTFVDSSGHVLDWYVDAASFTVTKTHHSTTSVLPPVDLSVKVN